MRILIVDDDIYSIEGLKSGVNWKELGITEISEAINANQARDVFESEKVDILLCDIEMPGKNGIELLEWVLENKIRVVTVFYSCHADFVYAQKALALKAFNYVLKPSPYDEIERILAEAVEKVKSDHAAVVRENRYEEWRLDNYEKFYLSCMDGTIPNNRKEIERTSVLRKVNCNMEGKLALILFSVDDWDCALAVMNRFDVNFCIKNMAKELYADNNIQKIFVIPYQKRLYAIILEYTEMADTLDREFLENRCMRLAKGFFQLLKSSLSYRYQADLMIEELGETAESLIFSLEGKNVLKTEVNDSCTGVLKQWKSDLIHGNGEKLKGQVDIYFDRINREGKADYYFIETFYHEYSHFILQILEAKKIDSRKILNSLEYKRLQPEARWSSGNLKKYVYLVNQLVMEVLETEKEPELIDQIKQYIELHIDEEISREKISEEVFINPDYMSRIFRKKTGISLNQYINEEKIKKVKELLDIPGISISDAAASVGYLNFSYFCQVFKRVTGETPSCYISKKSKNGDIEWSE